MLFENEKKYCFLHVSYLRNHFNNIIFLFSHSSAFLPQYILDFTWDNCLGIWALLQSFKPQWIFLVIYKTLQKNGNLSFQKFEWCSNNSLHGRVKEAMNCKAWTPMFGFGNQKGSDSKCIISAHIPVHREIEKVWNYYMFIN